MAASNGPLEVIGVKIGEQQRLEGQQIAAGGIRGARLEVAVEEMVGVDDATAVQPHEGIGQEVVGRDKRVLNRRVRQLAVV